MQTRSLWIGLVHVKPVTKNDWSAIEFIARPDEPIASSEYQQKVGAYSHLVTWASDAGEFRRNAEKVAADWKLYVVDIEGEKPLSSRPDLSEELEALARRAESNPNSIIFGTFHTYLHDDA